MELRLVTWLALLSRHPVTRERRGEERRKEGREGRRKTGREGKKEGEKKGMKEGWIDDSRYGMTGRQRGIMK